MKVNIEAKIQSIINNRWL